MRALSPETPFTDTMVITADPGDEPNRSKLSVPLPVFCTVKENE